MNSLVCFICGFVIAVMFCSFIFFKFLSDVDEFNKSLIVYLDKRIESLSATKFNQILDFLRVEYNLKEVSDD